MNHNLNTLKWASTEFRQVLDSIWRAEARSPLYNRYYSKPAGAPRGWTLEKSGWSSWDTRSITLESSFSPFSYKFTHSLPGSCFLYQQQFSPVAWGPLCVRQNVTCLFHSCSHQQSGVSRGYLMCAYTITLLANGKWIVFVPFKNVLVLTADMVNIDNIIRGEVVYI